MRSIFLVSALALIPAAAAAQDKRLVNGDIAVVDADVIGCRSDAYSRIEALDGDIEAKKVLIRTSLTTGQCAVIPAGSTVQIVGVAWVGPATELRRRGNPESFWVNSRLLITRKIGTIYR